MAPDTGSVLAASGATARPGMRGHAVAAVLFVLFATTLTWPLARHLGTHVPGTAPDDNMMFLWSIWWMREALADPSLSFFHTTHLFHPSGVPLALHTHTALNAFAGATLAGAAPLPVALNLVIIATCALNAFSAYLLAWHVSGHRVGSLLAGAFFASSPVMAAHLYGHFNLYTAWPLVLFALAVIRLFERPSWRRAIWAGATLAVVAYADYYYLVYAGVFLACVLIHRLFEPRVVLAPVRRPQTRTDVLLLAVSGAAAAVALLIAWTGGGVVTMGGLRVSLTRGANIRAIACALALVWLWRRWRPMLRIHVARERVARDILRAGAVMGIGLALMAPIVVASLALWRGGHYVSQTYLWRSSPAGADLATLALGNPFNGLWGDAVMRLYDALGINAFAGPLWLGVVPFVLVATYRVWSGTATSRLWGLVAVVFGLWAIGPYLLVMGIDTGLPTPQMLVRFVPVMSNARIPGHAAVFVSLAAAVLLAIVVRAWQGRRGRVAVLGLVILADFWTPPVPLTPLEPPGIDSQLASFTEGAVLELPLGIRDGFGMTGRFDPNVLYHQTIHGRPLTGGYIARLSDRVKRHYAEQPVLAALLRLSAGDQTEIPDPAATAEYLRASGIRFVVVEDRLSPDVLTAHVGRLPLRLIGRDSFRRLYQLE